MEVLIEDIVKIIDFEISSIESSILSITYPIEQVKSLRAVRDKLLWLRGKVLKTYEKHCDTERGFKWD